MKKIDLTFCIGVIGFLTLVLGICFSSIWAFITGFLVFCGACLFDRYFDFYLLVGNNEETQPNETNPHTLDSSLDSESDDESDSSSDSYDSFLDSNLDS